jgi:predicted phage-related endonuclease
MGSKPIGISASRGAAILGMSKYSTPFMTWLKIMEDREPDFCLREGYPKPEFVDNLAVHWGNALEDDGITLSEQAQDQVIGDRERLIESGDGVITCHVDGIYLTSGDVHEFKTVQQSVFWSEWGEPGSDRIPADYQIQVQHQLLLTGAKRAVVSALVLPKRQDEMGDPREMCVDTITGIANALGAIGNFHQYYVEPDPELHELMIDYYTRFWNENVIGRKPPEPQTFDDVKKMIREPVGTVLATEEIERWSTELSSIKDEVKRVTAREKELKKLISDFMRRESESAGVCIDDESTEKIILLSSDGYKLHSFYKTKNGSKVMR